MKNKLFLLALIVILVVGACGKKEEVDKKTPSETKENQPLTVYTTVFPLQYFAEQIGGDAVEVHSIYPPGADEHVFDPTQKDMMALADSDLFFYIGLGLEGFVENAKKTLKNEHVKMVATVETIPEDLLEEGHEHDEHAEDDHDHHDHDHGPFDPHVWISPELSIHLAEAIKDALIEQAPTQKQLFEDNFAALQSKLEQLDEKFHKMADEAPTKTFFVSHAAFGYIANAYGLEQVSIAGLDSQNEPSQKQLAKIVEQAKEKDVKYIIFEQNVSSKLTEVVQKEIGAEALMLHNLGVLTPEDVEKGETYFSLMERNIDVFTHALSDK